MGIRRKITQGLILCVLLSCLPSVAAEGPPCIAYAYVIADDEPHASLIASDVYVFGSRVVVESNCDNTSISVDGFVKSETTGQSLMTFIEAGEYSITLRNDGFNLTMDNVTFIQAGQLTQVINRLPSEFNPYSQAFTPEEITTLELVAGVGSMLISWLLVVGVLWRIINAHHDRNFIQEVA
tara:strand:+ start:1346 stop:1888 length:543 start_codon:yes stop_codon:yes gene_type:complete